MPPDRNRILSLRAHAVAASLIVAVAACTAVPREPPGAAPDARAPVGAGAVEPSQAAPQPSPEPAVSPPAETVTAAPPAAPSATPPVSDAAAGTKSAPVAAPAKPATSASVAPAPAPKPPAAAPPKPAAPPPLDLKSLETRLRDTNAIGVYTKLTLKNQVDDLLDSFRAYYKGQAKSTLAELRRAYDLLVLKVIALLQDADPPLASAIAASREAIWGILSDPAKFASV